MSRVCSAIPKHGYDMRTRFANTGMLEQSSRCQSACAYLQVSLHGCPVYGHRRYTCSRVDLAGLRCCVWLLLMMTCVWACTSLSAPADANATPWVLFAPHAPALVCLLAIQGCEQVSWNVPRRPERTIHTSEQAVISWIVTRLCGRVIGV